MPKQLRTTIPSHKLLWLIKNKIACLPIIYLLLTACHSNTVYHSYQSIPTTGWSKSDTLVYTLPASIPAGTYEMTIGIRHQESYPYRDLWINISTNVKDTSTYTTDTLQLFLADKTGNWTEMVPADYINLPSSIHPLYNRPRQCFQKYPHRSYHDRQSTERNQ